MNEIILAALLREWLDFLVNAIEGLEALPILKDGRKEVNIEELSELGDLWSVRNSMADLINRLEGGNR